MPHPDYLGEVLSARQFNEWLEFYGEEPFGFEVDDTRSALQALVIMRSQGDKRSRLEDFKFKRRPASTPGQPEDPEVLKQRIKALFGGAPTKK